MAQETEQTSLDGLHKTERKDWTHTRATQREITGTHDFGASSNIATARFFMRGPGTTTTAVVQLTLADHAAQWDLTTDGEFEILLLDDDTRGLTIGEYKYGIELVGSDGAEQAPLVGTISLTDEVVHDDATAAYLSWTTKSTYDAQLDALFACNIAAVLDSDASIGAGSIVVNAVPTGMAAGDTIIIKDATNQESHDIAAGGISGTTITLDATTLASAYTADITVVVKDF